MERETGIEPATLSLGRRSNTSSPALHGLYSHESVA
jgi:hypothetical protein